MTQQDLNDLLFDGLDLDLGIEDRLWNAANRLRANSTLKASEYATPVLGLIFLKYASNKFNLAQATVATKVEPWDEEEDIKKLYIAECGFYLPERARYSYLLEGKYKAESEGKKSLQKAIIEAMEAIEEWNENLNGTLPKQQYTAISDDSILENLLKEFSVIPVDAEGDLFGRIYEYFLGKFALAEGQKGGQFFTPTSIVKLIVEIIEPFKGKIFDPSCGSGGMFVQSAKFIKRHQSETNQLSIYGQERTSDTVDLAKMNLAVNGLNGDIRNVNSYYDDPFDLDDYIDEHGHGMFNFVMANPPFNVKDVKPDNVQLSTKFNYYGLPNISKKKTTLNGKKEQIETFANANYLWANLFGSTLRPDGRAGFVMANSASDARSAEQEVRKKLVEEDIIDVIIAVSSNFFLSVTLPITLWFYDKSKPDHRRGQTLFIDARNIYTQVDRRLRTFTQSQLFDLTAIVWLYRGEREKYQKLVKGYAIIREQWESGTISNPKDSAKPYQGIKKAAIATKNELVFLQRSLLVWYNSIIANLTPKKKQAAIDFSFKKKLEDVQPFFTLSVDGFKTTTIEELPSVYKTLEELTTFADRTLKPKGDKTFSKADIRHQLKRAQAEYAIFQFIQERINYFTQHIEWHEKNFPAAEYADVEGLCKVADLEEIEEQNYSLNAGRYVEVALEEDNLTKEEFKTEMLDLYRQLLDLNEEAKSLEKEINDNLNQLF